MIKQSPLTAYYHDLSDKRKTLLRARWCAQFKRTERQFFNRLSSPQPADYTFFSQVLDVPLSDLLQSLFVVDLSSKVLQTSVESQAEKFGLTRAS